MKKVQLKNAIKVSNEDVTEFELREPTVGDLRAARKGNQDDEIGMALMMFCRIATPSISPIEAEKIPLSDFETIGNAIDELMNPTED